MTDVAGTWFLFYCSLFFLLQMQMQCLETWQPFCYHETICYDQPSRKKQGTWFACTPSCLIQVLWGEKKPTIIVQAILLTTEPSTTMGIHMHFPGSQNSHWTETLWHIVLNCFPDLIMSASIGARIWSQAVWPRAHGLGSLHVCGSS